MTTHAVTIDAPPGAVWPWLVQMGWHRGGWYTARWVDRLLFPANRPSATRIEPSLQHLAPGDFVPDGPPESGCGFTVAELVPERHLVLHSVSHFPPSWRARFGAWMDFTWTFVLLDERPGDGAAEPGRARTRFVFRCRTRLGPWWMAAGYWLAVVPADFVMSRQMMAGVKARAEGTRAPADA